MNELEKAQQAAINHLRDLQRIGAERKMAKLSKEAEKLADKVKSENPPPDWWSEYERITTEMKKYIDTLYK
jgi:hypothetical protein